MANKTINQHFVPQSYMNRFAENERISVYDKKDGRILHNQNTRNFAAKRYYYDVNESELKIYLQEYTELFPNKQNKIDWNDSQLIEHYFSRAEADAKDLLDLIEQNPSAITTNGNEARLVIFLHDLYYRNQSYRDINDSINDTTYKHMYYNLQGKEKGDSEETLGAEQARKQQLHQITSIASVLRTNEKLSEYDIFFATAKKDARFLISDNPAFAVLADFSEFCFPISGKHALLFRKPNTIAPIMGNDTPVNNRIQISIPNVFKYNILQFANAERFIFGDKQNLECTKHIYETSVGKV